MDPLFWLKKRIVAIQDYDQHQHFCRELFLLGSSTPRVAVSCYHIKAFLIKIMFSA
jgi:hypothetical protein